jgi:hypothetical protein
MPLLDRAPILAQRAGVEIGRIRPGEMMRTAAGGMRPGTLETWKLTSRSRAVVESAAQQYGGQVKPYVPARGKSGWGVVTGTNALRVVVAPGLAVVTQSYEMWTAAGASRRCDSRYDQLNPNGGRAAPGNCRCPKLRDLDGRPLLDPDGYPQSDIDERKRLAGQRTPAACKPHTRITVILPQVDGIGMWRAESGGYVTADDITTVGASLDAAAKQGIYLPAELLLDSIEIRKPGAQVEKFAVIRLTILRSLQDIVGGQLPAGDIRSALPPAADSRPAIAAGGKPALPPAAIQVTARPRTAQAIADAAASATTPAEVSALMAEAAGDRLDDSVWIPTAVDPMTSEECDLRDYLTGRLAAVSRGPVADDDYTPPEQVAHLLAQEAAAAGGRDALTAIIGRAKAAGLLDTVVQADGRTGPLRDLITTRWNITTPATT